ncbi:MAG TPA: DinB family protein [Gemmatimonadales bacterium]|nr:DinB family protein [Gemmatimonadales bacterium]
MAQPRLPAGPPPSPVLIPAVRAIFERDLNTLRREVEAYSNDQQVWQIVPGLTNPAGTLVLHLAGNLQHYLGARLAGTGYVRNRDAEFSRRNVPRVTLLSEIEAAREAMRAGLAALSETQLAEEYPEIIAGARLVTGVYLIHLTTHLTYHLGQVDYHRRVVTGANVAVGAVRPSELGSVRAAQALPPH